MMTSDTLGRMLHDRSTRGETLSVDEQTQLETWYEQQDTLEGDILGTSSQDEAKIKLQSEVEAALIQLTAITKRIQDVAAENKLLRQEINVLHRQLSASSAVQQTV